MSILTIKGVTSVHGFAGKLLSGHKHNKIAVQKKGIQAIILAAGRGSRLDKANGGKPKCLAVVNGKRLIDHQLTALARAGVSDICVVTGYGAEQVRAAVGNRATFLHNPNWATSNSLYTLTLCRDWVQGRVLILNCDVLAHPDVMTRLVRSEQCSFAYDSTSGADDEDMKVQLQDGRLHAMSKVLPKQLTEGENVGILSFSMEAAQELFKQADELVRGGGKNLWLASAVERVAKRFPMHGVDVSDMPWIEIDYGYDLKRARRWIGPAIQTTMAPIDVNLIGAAA